MKIMAIAHTCVIDEYRKKYYYLCKNHNNLNLSLYIPNKWLEMNQWQKPKKNNYDKLYCLKICNTIKFWLKKPLLNITYIMPAFLKDMIYIKPDIIDIWEEPYSLMSFFIILLNKIFKIESKITFFSAQNLFKKYPFPFNIIQRYVLNNADHCYPISEDVLQVLKHHGFNKKYTILPLGVDFQGTENHYNAKNIFSIGFIGRLEKYKGIDDIIELFKKYSNNKNIIFNIAGQGSYSNKCKKYSDNHENFNFYGFVDNNKIKEFYSNIDILIVPSKKTNNWSEQFGRVIIEGANYDCIVIGSKSGEIPVVIDDPDNVFKEGDIDNMFNIINRYIDMKQNSPDIFIDQIQKNKTKINKKYSWDSISKKIYQMYCEMR